ncbi:MAG: hypothetical protein KJO54_04845 [Gammaproteobacteria bacterium]|nr:hypothetical protein [Gammaproteobacteria bacterium]NNF62607.1 hypothetical protein [Gammaproteobacteria bacterium]NNM20511.1 hypothetical protein [Gammaproteobacteria bacterium]
MNALVIQAGQEFECSLSRGWIEALLQHGTCAVVAHESCAEILDFQADPATFFALRHNPLDYLRLHGRLHRRRFDQVVGLDNTLLATMLLAVTAGAATRTRIGVGLPDTPFGVDALFAAMFSRFGITRPARRAPLSLTSKTIAAATTQLREIGFSSSRRAIIVAPARSDSSVVTDICRNPVSDALLPVMLLPAGGELELISSLRGRAYAIPAGSMAMRAALIGQSRLVVSDHPATLELAALMGTPTQPENHGLSYRPHPDVTG